jgi:hypothetical protein
MMHSFVVNANKMYVWVYRAQSMFPLSLLVEFHQASKSVIGFIWLRIGISGGLL